MYDVQRWTSFGASAHLFIMDCSSAGTIVKSFLSDQQKYENGGGWKKLRPVNRNDARGCGRELSQPRAERKLRTILLDDLTNTNKDNNSNYGHIFKQLLKTSIIEKTSRLKGDGPARSRLARSTLLRPIDWPAILPAILHVARNVSFLPLARKTKAYVM